jgi:Ca-activated chloride channel family protein
MIFRDPWVFVFLILIPPLVILSLSRAKRASAYFRFSTEELVSDLKPTLKLKMANGMVYLRAVSLTLLVFALARPQFIIEEAKTVTEGVDMVLTLDTSTSMLAEDFRIGARRCNRFDVVRDVVKNFIEKRKDDRIGVVAFAGRAYTAAPLTLDHRWLEENLDRVRVGMIEDATAIGSALATSLNRLKKSKAKSKIIILLTDGINNVGKITPLTAAEAAKAMKIKIYAIGVGTKGLVPYPMKDYFGNTVYQNIRIDIDDAALEKIASLTGGKYYRATDTEMLKRIYDEIDRLEKTKIEHEGYKETKELFNDFLIPAIWVLLFEIFLANTILVKIP